MINKKIINIRKSLDKLDDQFLRLIKKRTSLVNEIVKNKKFKKDIVDKKRINIILKNIKKKSISRKIDYKITEKIWSSMIKAYIDYEFRKFKKNNYLLCGGNFFSTKISCFLVLGLYFFNLSFSFAFSPLVGFFA